jgi:DNA repair exonuclease SbcCD ATPase subunit
MAKETKMSPEEELKAAQDRNKQLADELKKSQEAETKARELSESLKNDHLEEIEQLKNEHAANIDFINAVVEGLKATISELNAAIASKDQEAEKRGKRPVLKHKKGTYELRFPKFVHNFNGVRTEVDFKMLESNPELVEDLIIKGSGALIKKGGK